MEYSRSLVRSLDKSSRITLSASDHVTTFHLQVQDSMASTTRIPVLHLNGDLHQACFLSGSVDIVLRRFHGRYATLVSMK